MLKKKLSWMTDWFHKQNNKLHLGGQRRKQLPAFLLPALLSAEKDAKIKQLKNHTGKGAHTKRKMDDKIKNTSKPGVAYYHLPGLFEFIGCTACSCRCSIITEYFYNWCAIGSIYGALGDYIWGGGRGFGVQDPEDVMDLMREYGISTNDIQ